MLLEPCHYQTWVLPDPSPFALLRGRKILGGVEVGVSAPAYLCSSALPFSSLHLPSLQKSKATTPCSSLKSGHPMVYSSPSAIRAGHVPWQKPLVHQKCVKSCLCFPPPPPPPLQCGWVVLASCTPFSWVLPGASTLRA